MKKEIILATASPRRHELFKRLNLDYKVVVADIDENKDNHLEPKQMVMRIARRKAEHVFSLISNKNSVIIGADTVVVLNNKIFGKPKDKEHAKTMLSELSDNEHQVLTGVCILNGSKTIGFYEKTKVTFGKLNGNEIDDYIKTGEPMDKAGAYGYQGYAATFVKSIEGCYYNVMGLPLYRLRKELNVFLD